MDKHKQVDIYFVSSRKMLFSSIDREKIYVNDFFQKVENYFPFQFVKIFISLN